jgi:hypothetical protein
MALLLAGRPASALDSKVRITQYRHTAWRVQDGAFESAPNAITQTTDGYIWIGTDSGLVRFDGVRFLRWTSESDTSALNTAVVSLLGASDGTLWIGTATGLLSWKNGHLQAHLSGRIGDILEDHKRRIWAARSRAQQGGGLCHCECTAPAWRVVLCQALTGRRLVRNVRQPNHILANSFAVHKTERRPGADEEWLPMTEHDGMEVESILINQTKIGEASCQVGSGNVNLP